VGKQHTTRLHHDRREARFAAHDTRERHRRDPLLIVERAVGVVARAAAGAVAAERERAAVAAERGEHRVVIARVRRLLAERAKARGRARQRGVGRVMVVAERRRRRRAVARCGIVRRRAHACARRRHAVLVALVGRCEALDKLVVLDGERVDALEHGHVTRVVPKLEQRARL